MRRTARRYLSLHNLGAEEVSEPMRIDGYFKGKPDAYWAILSSDLPEGDKEPDRVAQEVLTLLVGGSVTTMRVMSRIIYHVSSSSHVLHELRKSLDAIMPLRTTHPELQVLENQEYLVSFQMNPLWLFGSTTSPSLPFPSWGRCIFGDVGIKL